jgi:Flp pilus assembly pilin Flp
MQNSKPNAVHVLARFLYDTRGATAVEYVVIGTMIGVGVLVGITAIPDALNTFFNNIGDTMSQP